tara:strand:+ start:348 stop:752 length:405 start_codon:yes stop_codon:yes gene_type:complete
MSDQTISALAEALEDEYKARATYNKVIEAFGPIRPFIKIVEAEGRHASALIRQFERLGIRPPKDTWAGNVKAPSSIVAACEAAIEGEIENAEMYDRLLEVVDDPIVRDVLLNLQDASQNRHLPAFRRYLDNAER